MVREIFADVDMWTFSDVQTGLKTREGGGVGEVRPCLEQSTKIRWNGDRQRYERREIVVDRKNDRYRQSWFDCETGERTFHKDGRNSDPTMHGSPRGAASRFFNFERAPSVSSLTIGGFAGCSATVPGGGSCPGSGSRKQRVSPA